jgi:hypothetical protein
MLKITLTQATDGSQNSQGKLQKLLFLSPVLGAAIFALPYLLKSPHSDLAENSQGVAKPSQFRKNPIGDRPIYAESNRRGAPPASQVKTGAPVPVAPTLASLASKDSAKDASGANPSKNAEVGKLTRRDPASVRVASQAETSDEAASSVGHSSPEVREQSAEKPVAAVTTAAVTSTAAAGVLPGIDAQGHCTRVEYRGDSPLKTRITKAQWSRVMDLFHESKRRLLGWLKEHEGEISSTQAERLARRVKELKVQRPPTVEEPDLAWRGIGVYSQMPGEPMVRLGGGFIQLIHQNPERALFELTRLTAQVWSPCELKRFEMSDLWKDFISCSQIGEKETCGVGTYSEVGWALSTTLATLVAPAGCQIPALVTGAMSSCVKGLSFKPNTAGKEQTEKQAQRAPAVLGPPIYVAVPQTGVHWE